MQPILTIPLPSGPTVEMILVEGGTFGMGGSDPAAQDWEKPVHKVRLPDFYIGKYQVTQRLWYAVMDNNPSRFKGENRPVDSVSWNDAQGFIEKLKKETGKELRLLTEAEWEFAARGGEYSEGYLYAGSDELSQVGWYGENSGGETHEVGMLRPNELVLHDMSGNVWEWCEDDWHGNHNGAPKDGAAWIDSPARGVRRVYRGGSYFFDPSFCRSTYRYFNSPSSRFNSLGLRLAVSLQSVG
jgi:formylglycine-generating enzyme required for sulfatase activity